MSYLSWPRWSYYDALDTMKARWCDFFGTEFPLFTLLSPGGACFGHPDLLPVHYLNNTWLDISSTRIRQLVKEGKSIRYLVLPEVMDYIHANQLYRREDLFVSRTGQALEGVGVQTE